MSGKTLELGPVPRIHTGAVISTARTIADTGAQNSTISMEALRTCTTAEALSCEQEQEYE